MLGREVFELVDRAIDYRGSHRGRPAATFRQMGVDSLTPTTVRRLVNLEREPVVTVSLPPDRTRGRSPPAAATARSWRRRPSTADDSPSCAPPARARSARCASATVPAAEHHRPLSMFFATLDLVARDARRCRPGAMPRAVGLTHWAVRSRRITPFGAWPRFMRRASDPVLLPLERRVIRAGGSPQDAPLWLIGIVDRRAGCCC